MTLAAASAFPDIAASRTLWSSRLNSRIAEYVTNCPVERARTLYFANDGDNDTGDGSMENPYATRAKAIELASSNTAYLFKCGDTFYETGNWALGSNQTVSYWGDLEDGLPLFDRSTIFKLNASNPWGNPTGAMGRKDCAETTAIAWLKIRGDLGITRPLARASSAADCETRANSWCWVSNVLYVNLNGDDPNDFDFDCIVSNDGESGVEFTGDGSIVRYIRGMGWGLHTATIATQDQPFTSRCSGDNANIIEHCEAYYSGTHCIAHYTTSSGGRMLVRNCKAGWTLYSAGSGETVYNTFAETGGHETLFIDNEVTNGTLPSSDWAYATLRNRGGGFYSHRGVSGTTSLIITKGNTIKNDTPYGALWLARDGHPTASTQDDWTTFRSFVVGNTMEMPLGATSLGSFDLGSDMCYYNNIFRFYPSNGGVEALGTLAFTRMAFLQNYLHVDMTSVTGAFGTYNTPAASDNIGDFYYNFIFYDNTNSSGAKGLFDYDVGLISTNTGNGVVGAGPSRNSRFVNNIVCAETAGVNVFLAGTNSTRMKGNRVFGLTQTTDRERGWNTTTDTQALGSLPVFGTSISGILAAGNSERVFTHDINDKRRATGIIDIGPVDFSSPAPDPATIDHHISLSLSLSL